MIYLRYGIAVRHYLCSVAVEDLGDVKSLCMYNGKPHWWTAQHADWCNHGHSGCKGMCCQAAPYTAHVALDKSSGVKQHSDLVLTRYDILLSAQIFNIVRRSLEPHVNREKCILYTCANTPCKASLILNMGCAYPLLRLVDFRQCLFA